MSEKIVVLTNCGTAEEAHRIARTLVEARLAACANILPAVQSIYRWQGVIETASEWTIVIKSTRPLFENLRRKVREIHSYQVPEVIAVTIVEGDTDYLNWIELETDGTATLRTDVEA